MNPVFHRRLLRWFLLPLLAGWLLAGLSDQAVTAFQSPADKKAPAPPPQPASKGLEGFKIPTDALIVICEQAADAVRLLPRMVVLTPEKVKEWQDEIDRLQKRLRLERPQPPSLCHLEGKLEGQLVQLDVRYEVVTERPGTVVALGCKQAQLSRLSLEGKTPLVRGPDAEGYTVQIENPGTHQLKAHFTMALGMSGATRSLELELPRAAGTTLKLQIPGEVKELRINDKALADTVLTFKGSWLEGSHGTSFSDRLALSWKGANSLPGGAAVLTAESKILARIDEQMWLHTEAKLQLKVQGGTTKQWRLLVPPGAQLLLAAADEEKLTIENQELAGASLRILRLKEASAAPLAVSVVTPPRPASPGSGSRPAIGPFALLGATRQTGSIVLVLTAAGLQVQPSRPGTTTPRTATAEESKLGPLVRAFNFELPPLTETPPFLDRGADPAALNLLELEGETMRARLEARVSHVLRPGRKEGMGDKRFWENTTTLEVKLLQPGTALLEVQLPRDWGYVPPERWPEPVTDIRLDESSRIVQVRLQPESSGKPFQLTLRTRSGQPMDDSGKETRQTIDLPRLRGSSFAAGFQVLVHVPDDLELVPLDSRPAGLDLSQPGPQEQVWRLEAQAEQTPRQIELAWRSHRPRVRAASVIDLNLTSTQARIRRHELRLLYPRTPARIALRVPPEVAGTLAVLEGGTLLESPAGGTTRLVELPPTERHRTDQEVKLVLDYSLALGDLSTHKPSDPPLRVPLVAAEDATQGETRVRVWNDPDLRLGPAGGNWLVSELEKVKEDQRLPGVVLLSHHPERELPLLVSSAAAGTGISVLIERALIRVEVVEGVGQHYRASYRLARLSSHHLEVRLPAAAETIHLRIKLDGTLLVPKIGDDPGLPGEEGAGRLARVDLGPLLVQPDSLLEISYQLPPEELTGRGGLVQVVLLPPVVVGAPPRVLTRWQVHVPVNWVVLGPEGGPGSERAWGRRGLLLAPRLAITGADLERWLIGPRPESPSPKGPESAGPDTGTPSLTCWRGGQEPLAVTHLPQQAWLLLCSLLVLLLGLAVSLLARQPRTVEPGTLVSSDYQVNPIRVGLALTVLGLGVVIAGVFWPGLLAAIFFGCQPGLLVLALVLLIQLLLHERHRRRLVFLPSFSRRTGSSLNDTSLRPSSARRVGPRSGAPPRASMPGEPSTIDEPRSV